MLKYRGTNTCNHGASLVAVYALFNTRSFAVLESIYRYLKSVCESPVPMDCSFATLHTFGGRCDAANKIRKVHAR